MRQSENSDNKESSKNVSDGVPARYTKLVADMNLVKGNINFTNEIID